MITISWLDPYHGGSHAAVSAGYATATSHSVQLLTLPIYAGWRWRMRGAALTLARMLHAAPQPDLIVTTDMLDVATFRAFYEAGTRRVPTIVYFHENQLTYPLPGGRPRDLSFAWTNFTTALAADAVCFNSAFHRAEFLNALPGFLGRYHDHQELAGIDAIAAKAHVLPPGIDLRRHDAGAAPAATDGPPIILWNSRWEYDKQPELFFAALEELAARGIDFRLIVAGAHIDPQAPAFAAARERWAAHTLHWGFAAEPADYSRLLHQADVVVSTALQEFFGIAVVEALYCGCMPILPQRLAYPELLPAAYHADCLYRTRADLVEQLAAVLQQPALRQRSDWRAIAAPYDWAQIAPRYDALFAQIGSKDV